MEKDSEHVCGETDIFLGIEGGKRERERRQNERERRQNERVSECEGERNFWV